MRGQHPAKTPAIVLSTHTVGLGVLRALGAMRVPLIAAYYETPDMGYVSRYVTAQLRTPHPEDEEDAFIGLLIDCAGRFGRCLLIPADDATLSAVSKHKALLQAHHIVACTEWSIAEQFIDKQHTYALAEKMGIPAPRTLLPRSAQDVEQYAGTVRYPCLIKPTHSHLFFARFRTKMVEVADAAQMLAAYRQADDAGLQVLIQERIPGDDSHGVNYNAYVWDGEPLVEFTAAKVRLSPPRFGVPRVVISRQIPEVIAPGRRILKAMGYYGYACTEFKRDPRDGIYKLMEVNGRHNRSVLLAVACGINFPWLEYRHLTQDEKPAQAAYEEGTYWIDEYRDLFHTLRFFGREGQAPMDYLRPYLKRHVFATFQWSDPKPFMKRCADLLRGALHRPATPHPTTAAAPTREVSAK